MGEISWEELDAPHNRSPENRPYPDDQKIILIPPTHERSGTCWWPGVRFPASKSVQGSIRVMPVCLVMGEAADAASAMAATQEDPDVRAVDTANSSLV